MIFVPEPVGGYGPDILIHSQEPLLPDATWDVLSSMATRDVHYASAALAFQMATATAFHILRATENLLDDYYEHFVPKDQWIERRKRTWGNMERALEKHADSRMANVHTIHRLANLRETYRNPTFHPEIEYEIDDAVSLFMDCRVALVRMAEDMVTRTSGDSER